jgi:hypothetical protein
MDFDRIIPRLATARRFPVQFPSDKDYKHLRQRVYQDLFWMVGPEASPLTHMKRGTLIRATLLPHTPHKATAGTGMDGQVVSLDRAGNVLFTMGNQAGTKPRPFAEATYIGSDSHRNLYVGDTVYTRGTKPIPPAKKEIASQFAQIPPNGTV